MPVTQDYKILSLDSESVTELLTALSAQILRVQIQGERADTVDGERVWLKRELCLRNVYAQLMLP